MKRKLVVAGLVALILGAWTVRQQQAAPPEPNQVSVFMKAKLEHAQKILGGLVLEDFGLIDKEAQRLALLSQASTWQVLQTEEYLQHSNEFRRSTNALSTAAQEKNLDGAALAYMEMTMKCINCHKYVRDTRVANVNLPRDVQVGE
jgi:hypothetical protein